MEYNTRGAKNKTKSFTENAFRKVARHWSYFLL